MSETGVGLSDLPDGWVWATVKEIAEFIRGVSYKKNESSKTIKEGHVPILRANNINRELNYTDLVYVLREKIKNEQFVKVFDIVVAMSSGSKNLVGKAAQSYQDYHGGFGTFCGLVRVALQLDRKFIGFFFQSPGYRNEISHLSSGMNINNLRRQHIESMCLPIPPLSEQHRIVAKIEELFTKLDAGVNELYKAQSQLKRYRQSVLKSAFEGKLTEAWRVEHQDEIEPAAIQLECILKERWEKWKAEQLKQMRAKEKMPKDDKWKAKYKEPVAPDMIELPKLPKGWTWATVEQLSTKIQYGSSKKTDADSNGVPVLRMGNIVDGKIVLNNLKYLPKEHNEFPELLLNKGDLLFNRTNSRELVGKTAVYTGIPNPCSFASYLIRVRFHPSIDSMIAAYYINSVYGKDWILSVVSQQAGQANVNGTKLKLFAVPMPPEKEQQVLVEEVERHLFAADEVEKTITAELKRAEQLRQSILKKAFSGKLVSQDPNDEPASILLERIKAEKSQHTQRQPRLKLA